MPNARVQHSHGTYSNYEANKTAVLNDEIAIVDSGHPDTKEGAAAYYRPAGASEPVRLANASEVLKITMINESTFPESAEWGDEIPDTFEGLTGEPPELAFWNNNLWFLSEVIVYPQSYTHYYWLRIATSDDIN